MLQRRTLPPPPPLARFERPALFLDFDGTLIELASAPDAIEVCETLAGKLLDLARRVEGRLAIVSGRSIDNLIGFLGPIATHLAGSHGGHVVSRDGAVILQAEALPAVVGERLTEFSRQHDLLYERKSHGAALHYRNAPQLEEQAHSFAAKVAAEQGLTTKRGKFVIELVRPGADKGGALRLLMQQPDFLGATPVFVGDDVTDEDGMAAAVQFGGCGIAVGDRPLQHASYHLPTVKDVHKWLKL